MKERRGECLEKGIGNEEEKERRRRKREQEKEAQRGEKVGGREREDRWINEGR